MSPRQKVAGTTSFDELPPRHPRRWAFPVVLSLAAALIVAAVAVSTAVLITHERHHREAFRDVEVISYVRTFMTQFTTMDPFNANDYVERITAQGTGKFAEDYRTRMNEVAVAVARTEPTQGQVLDAGIERWNDDGSASVVTITKTVTTMPDGKKIEDLGRWVARTVEEGDQWKISDLVQVI